MEEKNRLVMQMMKYKIILPVMIIISTLVIGCIRQEERGFLEVSVSIGPLCPVEPCDITPKQLEKMYEGIKIFIYSENKILVKEIKLDNTGNYKTGLIPGRYIIDTGNIGIGGSKDLPKEVKIESGKTIKLKINIDTGIRTPTSIQTSTSRHSGFIPIEHIIFIAFENKKYDSVIATGPYFKYLADTYGRATQAYDIYNICNGVSHSLPSYLTVTSGSPFNKCGTDKFTAGEFDTKNIFSLVNDADMTWVQYAEGISDPCSTKGTKFAARHVPALFYRNIVQNPDKDYCKNHVVPLTDWYNNISSDQIPPNLAFISPDLCNDAHDCSISIADNWLKNTFNLPNLLTKSWAQSTVFFIWFDEGYGQPGYFVVVSPYSMGKQYTGIVSNYNILTTMEWLLGLNSSGNNDDTNKNPPMKDLFGQ